MKLFIPYNHITFGPPMRFLLLMFLFPFAALLGQDLVDIQEFIPTIRVENRYATPNNFTGRPLYRTPRVYVHHNVARHLARIHRILARDCIGLVIYEGYRPPSVQRLIDRYAAVCDCPERVEEAPHYRKGLGVDVGLYYLDGLPMEFQTCYDEKCANTSRTYIDYPAHVYHNSAMLEAVMSENGFVPCHEKWWHFDMKSWEFCPDLEVECEELLKKG